MSSSSISADSYSCISTLIASAHALCCLWTYELIAFCLIAVFNLAWVNKLISFPLVYSCSSRSFLACSILLYKSNFYKAADTRLNLISGMDCFSLIVYSVCNLRFCSCSYNFSFTDSKNLMSFASWSITGYTDFFLKRKLILLMSPTANTSLFAIMKLTFSCWLLLYDWLLQPCLIQ